MSTTIKKQQKGFTLIEMLVSVALFSVVLTVTLGTVLTIADSNKKARSLMSVTNNLNFAIDSMTRSIKSGKMGTNPLTGTGNGECLTTEQINYSIINPTSNNQFQRETIEYCFDDGKNTITQKIGSNDAIQLVSEDVTVDYLEFDVIELDGEQLRVLIVLGGTVEVSPKISSAFSIQTTVAQREINVPTPGN